MIKIPKTVKGSLEGEGYVYMDEYNLSPTFSDSSINIDSPLTHTVDQLNLDTDISYVLYK